MKATPKVLWFWITFVIWLILDQASKIWIVSNLEKHVDEIELIPGLLSFIHAQNPGAAFSMLAGFEYRNWVFGVFTIIALVVVAQMYRSLRDDERLLPMALGLVLSGAIGNAIDRLHKGTVTDFVKVYTDDPAWSAWLVEWFNTAEYPTFNIADAALLIGVIIFFVHGMIYGDPAARPAEDAAAPVPEPDDAEATG